MHSSRTLPSSRRVPTLDGARSRGIYVQFYDPDGRRYGIPTYPYHWAPKHLYTGRQLRVQGLRPGGQQPTAQILWRRGLRVAYLYRADLALPKRQATPAQLAAIAKALAARRTCPACGTEQPYCLPLHRPVQRLHRQGHPMTPPACPGRCAVNKALTAKRRYRIVENDQYTAFLRRIIAAYSRRVAAGDIEAITGMAALADDLEDATRQAITGLRESGYSWADIALRLGITRQGAQQRWADTKDPS
jgi:hypothetical protein